MNKDIVKCPLHKEQAMYRLRYQKKTKEKPNPLQVPTDWYYCEQCKVPMLVSNFTIVKSVIEVQEASAKIRDLPPGDRFTHNCG